MKQVIFSKKSTPTEKEMGLRSRLIESQKQGKLLEDQVDKLQRKLKSLEIEK